MAKNNQNSALSALAGIRAAHGLDKPPESPEVQSEKPSKSKNQPARKSTNSHNKETHEIEQDKVKSGKSAAGRKSIPIEKRKVQMTLTLSPKTCERLKKWAKERSRSAPNYVSEYVETHIEDIINYSEYIEEHLDEIIKSYNKK